MKRYIRSAAITDPMWMDTHSPDISGTLYTVTLSSTGYGSTDKLSPGYSNSGFEVFIGSKYLKLPQTVLFATYNDAKTFLAEFAANGGLDGRGYKGKVVKVPNIDAYEIKDSIHVYGNGFRSYDYDSTPAYLSSEVVEQWISKHLNPRSNKRIPQWMKDIIGE